jgi:hypothetical protein
MVSSQRGQNAVMDDKAERRLSTWKDTYALKETLDGWRERKNTSLKVSRVELKLYIEEFVR